MMRTWIDRTSILDAPIDEVGAVLADIDRWPEWSPGLIAVRRRPGPLVPGRTRFWMHLRIAPLPATIVPCQLFELGPTRIAWGGRAFGTRIVHRFDLRELPGGRTELRHVEDASTLLGVVLRPFERVIASYDQRWSDAIEARFATS